jgi:putative transposase
MRPDPAKILLDQLLECREKGFFRLHSFVVMPEHLHILITPGEETSLEKSVQMVKGGSAYKIRKALNYRFPIWQSRFHDRWIRDAHEYRMREQYIHLNPVKARLAERPCEYAFGSASGNFTVDPCEFGAADSAEGVVDASFGNVRG